MKTKLLIVLVCVCRLSTINAQKPTEQQKENLQYKTDIFMSDNEELQTLWYEDLMDRMKLKDQLRKDYQDIVKYHAIKMKRLDNPESELTFQQTKSALQKQITMLNEDVEVMLNDQQFKLHKKSWKAILKAVLTKIEN